MEVAEKLCSKILIIDHGREVVSGALSDVKGRYGKKSVVVEFDGNIDFDRLSRLIAHVTKFPRWVEIELAEGASAQELLKILAAEVSIQRFEIVAPSLHKIFVDKLGNGKGVISNE
jgi:ABC-2 type transport system ATP-binding protein